MRSVKEVEWFRPLVGSQQWDYIVIWKLGNDPSRFIEWIGCCCSGGCENGDFVKEEKYDKLLLCRDISLKHYVKTKACESLSNFPSSMDLYSGVHSEVVISKQLRWINQLDGSESITSQDGIGTRVFVPVKSGLIEFYSTKIIPNDKKVLDLILAHCKMVSFEKEATSPSEVISEMSTITIPSPLQRASRSCSSTSIEGSSSISNSIIFDPSDHLVLFDSNFDYKSKHKRASGSINVDYEVSRQQDNSVIVGCEAEKSGRRANKRKEKNDYQSKNLFAERERRRRIRDGLLTLRSLVPKITKMDMASILGDAVEYIVDLKTEEMEFRSELDRLEGQECRKSKDMSIERKSDKAKRLDSRSIHMEKTCSSLPFGPKKHEVKVEVNQIDNRKFFVKLFVGHKRGEFVRLLEVMNSFNLEVVSVNSVAFNGRVQNILELKAEKDVELKALRDFFIKLTS